MCATALLLSSLIVLAAPASPEAEASNAAGVRYRRGVELAKSERWSEALAELTASAEIIETQLPPAERRRFLPAVLYEIGLAFEHLPGEVASAFDAYERYLAEPPEAPNPRALEHARGYVEEHE